MSAARLRRKQGKAAISTRPSPTVGYRSRATQTTQVEKAIPGEKATPVANGAARPDDRLIGLSSLASVDIETTLVANLSGELHALFDPVSDCVLPIYFGPLLGRLYLEGL